MQTMRTYAGQRVDAEGWRVYRISPVAGISHSHNADMWQNNIVAEDNPLQIARFFKGENPDYKPGYYIGRMRWAKWIGPFKSLRIAKDAALYLEEDPPS